MTTRYSTCILSVATLLSGACAPPAPVPAAPQATPTLMVCPPITCPNGVPAPAVTAPPTAASTTDLVEWWQSSEVLLDLGLTVAEGAAMAPELDKLQRNYQVAQRQLQTIRLTQLQMLRDPKVPAADIRRFHVRNLQHLLTTMLDQNIAARLWVRGHLQPDQLTRIQLQSPQFFEVRWFRAARVVEE